MANKTTKSPDPTRLGTVEDVSGPTVRIKLSDDTATGLIFVRGEGYRVGQVGSFIRIPAGYMDLFGVVSQVGLARLLAHRKQPQYLEIAGCGPN